MMKMNVIAIRAPGGPEVLVPSQLDRPSPGVGQVLVKVAACGLCQAPLRPLLEQGAVAPHGLLSRGRRRELRWARAIASGPRTVGVAGPGRDHVIVARGGFFWARLWYR